jgi:hypothetical protein
MFHFLTIVDLPGAKPQPWHLKPVVQQGTVFYVADHFVTLL